MEEEKLGIAMTALLLEDALNAAAGMSRSDEFVSCLLERKCSGVDHFDSDAVNDDEKNDRRCDP